MTKKHEAQPIEFVLEDQETPEQPEEVVEPVEPETEPTEPTGETPEAPEDDESTTDDAAEDGTEGEDGAQPDTFPRAYVEKLRKEAGDARVRAQKADELAGALWEARVAATGRLADPTDLPMPEGADPLDVDALTAAVDDLLARKPHLASRVPRGNVGAGVVTESTPFSLGGMIRAAAR